MELIGPVGHRIMAVQTPIQIHLESMKQLLSNHFVALAGLKVGIKSDSQKTKKFEFGKTFMVILFEIKNNPYTPIFSLVGVGLGEISG